MSFRFSEKERIKLLRERISAERELLREEARVFAPKARKAAMIGSGAYMAKKFAPILRPILFGLLQRSLAKRGKRGLLKFVGLAGIAFGVGRFLLNSSEDDD